MNLWKKYYFNEFCIQHREDKQQCNSFKRKVFEYFIFICITVEDYNYVQDYKEDIRKL